MNAYGAVEPGTSLSRPRPRPDRAGLADLLRSGRGFDLMFSPVVDLVQGRIAGYEAIPRFTTLGVPGSPTPHPRAGHSRTWFTFARQHGCEGPLAAGVLRAALKARAALPSYTFLLVTVGRHLLADPGVRDALAGDLRGLVVALAGPDGTAATGADVSDLRARGAVLATEEAATGYAALREHQASRPGMVRLDRLLIRGIDVDPMRQTLLRQLGSSAAAMDAWLLAGGIATQEELTMLVALGVPLGQGPLFGLPSRGFAELDADVAELVRHRARRARSLHTVASLVIPATTRRAGERHADDGLSELTAVVLDDTDRPRGLIVPGGHTRHGVMTLHPDDDVAASTARAMARPVAERLDPLVLTGARGQVLGLVTVDALALRLAVLLGQGIPAQHEPVQASERDEATHRASTGDGQASASRPFVPVDRLSDWALAN